MKLVSSGQVRTIWSLVMLAKPQTSRNAAESRTTGPANATSVSRMPSVCSAIPALIPYTNRLISAKQPSGDERFDTNVVGMRGEDRRERGAVGHRPAHLVVTLGSEVRQQRPDVDDALLDQLGGLDQLLLEAEGGIDRLQRGLEGFLVERGFERGVEQFVLVGEDPEDRAFGNAGGAGNLLGGDRLAVLGEQGAHGLDDRRPAFFRWQR